MPKSLKDYQGPSAYDPFPNWDPAAGPSGKDIVWTFLAALLERGDEPWKQLTSRRYRQQATEKRTAAKKAREDAAAQELAKSPPPAPAPPPPPVPVPGAAAGAVLPSPIRKSGATRSGYKMGPPPFRDESLVQAIADPAYPQEGGFAQDEIMARFSAMNPDLDWKEVAKQAGGNVPGGSFSAMESDIKQKTKGASDEEFYKWVEDITFENNMRSLLDPRSRSFNPQAAELLIARRESEKSSAAEMIKARAEQLAAESSAGHLKLLSEQDEFSRSAEGQAMAMLDSIIQGAGQNMDPILFKNAVLARTALINGDYETAMRILSEIGGSSLPTAPLSPGSSPSAVIDYEDL
jgi:hypothetical protein